MKLFDVINEHIFSDLVKFDNKDLAGIYLTAPQLNKLSFDELKQYIDRLNGALSSIEVQRLSIGDKVKDYVNNNYPSEGKETMNTNRLGNSNFDTFQLSNGKYFFVRNWGDKLAADETYKELLYQYGRTIYHKNKLSDQQAGAHTIYKIKAKREKAKQRR